MIIMFDDYYIWPVIIRSKSAKSIYIILIKDF